MIFRFLRTQHIQFRRNLVRFILAHHIGPPIPPSLFALSERKTFIVFGNALMKKRLVVSAVFRESTR